MSTKYVLVFWGDTASYRAHVSTCSAATSNRDKVALATFDTIDEAHAWADRDESEKAGEPTSANFKRCPCTVQRTGIVKRRRRGDYVAGL